MAQQDRASAEAKQSGLRDLPESVVRDIRPGVDLALALIEEDAGREVAMNVARMLVVYLKRTGGQSQYSALLAAQVQSESETFDSLDRWITEHLNDDLRVGALAEQVHMSPRNFARAYAEKRDELQQRPWRRYG